jgi:hypothetical protein
MKLFISFFLFFFLVFLSCDTNTKKKDENAITKDSIVDTRFNNNKNLKVKLNSISKKELLKWKEYKDITEFIEKYYQISNEEALSNIKELSELATYLKDSIRDKRLQSSQVKSRINVFYNECKRLDDMSNIPAIQSDEVSKEIKKVLESYASLNAKLNSVYQVRNLENELELDPDFEKILNDSTHTKKIKEENKGASEIMKRAKIKKRIKMPKELGISKKIKQNILKKKTKK